MKLRELEHIITEDSSVSVQVQSNNDLPFLYDSWKECKKDFKGKTWDEDIILRSCAGIQILFINC